MSSKYHGTTSKGRLQPAEELGPAELVRLGEFAYSLGTRLQDAALPLPPPVKEDPFFQQALAAGTAPDFVAFGERIRDLHVRLGGYSYRLSLARGKLFWEALNAAIDTLALGKATCESFQKAGRYAEGEIPDARPISMEETAQSIINGAFADLDELPPPSNEQVARIQFALALDQSCSDAYLIQGTLDEQAGRFREAQASFERAMELAAEKLGPDAFSEESRRAERVHFWYSTGTREYMRPRAALAYLYWRKMGNLEETIAHFQALLDLNPSDNQGNRDALLCCLLEAGHDAALGRELTRFHFDKSETVEPQDIAGTVWHYTNACWLFRRGPNTTDRQKATQALTTAFKHNRFVPLFLLAPDDLPDLDELSAYSYGDTTEAAIYVNMALKGWEKTPGALAWLEEEARRARLYPMTGREIPPIHINAQRR